MKRKILITGGSGFIGSGLKNCLKDSEILTIGRSEKEDVRIDLRDLKLQDIVKSFSPDIVCHFASGSNIARAEQNKEKEFNDTVLATKNLISAVVESPSTATLPKIIYLSTQAVYGLPEHLPVGENHPTKPVTIYGENKLKVENLILESGLDHLIFRVSSAYGPLQNPAKSGVIAKFINKLKNNESPIVFNSVNLYSDFIYVDDIVSVLLKSITEHIFQEKGIYNLGCGNPITIKELLKILYKHFPEAPEPKFEVNKLYPDKEQKGLYLDISKIKNNLLWSPKYSIEDGLKLMLEKLKFAETI